MREKEPVNWKYFFTIMFLPLNFCCWTRWCHERIPQEEGRQKVSKNKIYQGNLLTQIIHCYYFSFNIISIWTLIYFISLFHLIVYIFSINFGRCQWIYVIVARIYIYTVTFSSKYSYISGTVVDNWKHVGIWQSENRNVFFLTNR